MHRATELFLDAGAPAASPPHRRPTTDPSPPLTGPQVVASRDHCAAARPSFVSPSPRSMSGSSAATPGRAGSADPAFPAGSWLAQLQQQETQLETILRAVEQSGQPFRDPLFPAGAQAIGERCTGCAEVVSWRRPADLWGQGEPLLFKGDVAPSDVIQGRLKDCWLLGALGVVSLICLSVSLSVRLRRV